MREDIVRVNKDNMTLLNAYADAQAEMGNDGPAAIVQFVNELDDVANNPILRFGANAMTAFDGFTRLWSPRRLASCFRQAQESW